MFLILIVFSAICDDNKQPSSVSNSDILKVEKLKFTGLSSPQTYNSILKFLIVNGNLTVMPDNINALLPSIQFLGVVRTNLKILKRSNFEGMHMLRSLDLKENQISQLSADVFAHLIGLMKINLSHNSIKSMANYCRPLIYLLKFIANDNQIEIFDASYFPGGKSYLQEIHLWSNKITLIRMDLNRLKQLKITDFRNNSCIDRMTYFESEYDTPENLLNDIKANCSQKLLRKNLKIN